MIDQAEPIETGSQTAVYDGRGGSRWRSVFFKVGETPRQAGILFTAQMGSMVATFVSTLVQTRWMSPSEFGHYVFCITVIVIAGLIIELGIFPAGGRVLALLHDRKDQRNALGAIVLLSLLDGLLLAVALISFSGLLSKLFKLDVQDLLIVAGLTAIFLPLQRVVEEACQGLNEIRRLSQFQITMSVGQLVLFLALGVSHKLTATTAIIAYSAGIAIASIWTIGNLRPGFHSLNRFARKTLAETKSYGFNAYLGRITATTTTRLDNLIVTYFLGAAPLGIYFTAQKFSGPITTMSRSLAITSFRVFASLKSIPSRITRWNTIALVVSSAALALAGPVVLRLLFPPKYAAAATLLIPFALLNFFQGLFQPYNIFLAAHGRGAELRNTAVIFTIVSIVGLLVLTPRFGVDGAAWSGVIAMTINYLLNFVYYRNLKNRLEPPATLPTGSEAGESVAATRSRG